MRALALAAVACAALAAGCSSPCQELGDRLCDCRDPSVTKASCTDSVKAEVQRLNPGSSASDACNKALDECHAPRDVSFCDWLEGRCGKAACGMSQEEISDLRDTPVDPEAAACQPDPTVEACPKLCE
jgi:hypothetical protein